MTDDPTCFRARYSKFGCVTRNETEDQQSGRKSVTRRVKSVVQHGDRALSTLTMTRRSKTTPLRGGIAKPVKICSLQLSVVRASAPMILLSLYVSVIPYLRHVLFAESIWSAEVERLVLRGRRLLPLRFLGGFLPEEIHLHPFKGLSLRSLSTGVLRSAAEGLTLPTLKRD